MRGIVIAAFAVLILMAPSEVLSAQSHPRVYVQLNPDGSWCITVTSQSATHVAGISRQYESGRNGPVTGAFSVPAQQMKQAPHTLSFWAKLDPAAAPRHVLLGRAALWVLKPGESAPNGVGMTGDPMLLRVPYSGCDQFFKAMAP